MLTPQDISEKGFDKVMLNGYDTGEVDDFLDAVSNDYNALYKENAILKGKLKVLVEKVEEYRSTEDAMRMALLTAQRMGEEITNEANRAKDEMLMKTDAEVKAKLTDTEKRIAEEEMRLSVATKETAKFIEFSQAVMRKHSEFLERLEAARRAVGPRGDAKQGAPAKAGRTVKASGQNKAARQQQQSAQQQPVQQQAQPAPEQPVSAPAPAADPYIAAQDPMLAGDTRPIPTAANQDFEIDDIASQISSVVGQMSDDTGSSQFVSEPVATIPNDPPPSLFEDDDGSVKLYTQEDDEISEDDERISPRPKFDFDDLKFGANFDSDD